MANLESEKSVSEEEFLNSLLLFVSHKSISSFLKLIYESLSDTFQFRIVSCEIFMTKVLEFSFLILFIILVQTMPIWKTL